MFVYLEGLNLEDGASVFDFQIYLLILLLIFSHSSCSEDMLEKKNKFENQKPKHRPLNLDLPDTQTYYQGWVKYYHYEGDTHYDKPPALFQNNQFESQRIPKSQLSEKNKFGSMYIPNKASFFMVVYKESLSIFSERKNQVNHHIDNI